MKFSWFYSLLQFQNPLGKISDCKWYLKHQFYVICSTIDISSIYMAMVYLLGVLPFSWWTSGLTGSQDISNEFAHFSTPSKFELICISSNIILTVTELSMFRYFVVVIF